MSTPSAATPLGGAVFGLIADPVVSQVVEAPGFTAGVVAGRVGGRRTEDYGSVAITLNLQTPVPVRYGFLTVPLPRMLPHYVVDAIANDGPGRSSLPLRISGRHRLRLEGDFDRHFALYAPEGAERDALELFTPDVMALLIDEAGDLDVEVWQDRLTVFSPRAWDPADPATRARLERLADVLGAKASRIARRRRGPIGRRLDQGIFGRRGILVGFWVTLVVVLAATAAFIAFMFAITS